METKDTQRSSRVNIGRINDDVILGYFDTLQEAHKYEQELDMNRKCCKFDSAYGQIDMVNVYQLKGVPEND